MTNRIFKTGVGREQASLLPARVEDYVGCANPVRGIEAYVSWLDLAKLGLRHAGRGGGAGQPPYDPADLLKLYLYGYLNQIRSSRRLAREAARNVELMWLLRGLTPGYRTIAEFRKENWAALKAANRDFVALLREAELLGGELVAIDGAFFEGNAGKGSITTRKKLLEQLAAIDRDLEAYRAALEANDAEEERSFPLGDGGDFGGKIAALLEQRSNIDAGLEQLASSGETQLSRTDPDARLLSKSGQTVAGYNVQIAVDARHKLIVASEVVNDGNDTGQFYSMARAAKDALGAETLEAVADAGYFNGAALKACEDDKIVAYVPQPERSGKLKGRFGREDFSYDAEANVYRCPAGETLAPGGKLKRNGERMELRYVTRKATCDGCAWRAHCVTDKQPTRTVCRWIHEDVVERHRERMKDAGALMRRRAGLAEHPFGTLKCRAGYRHFLVRGLEKVRGELSLMVLCYNFTRMLNIIGLDRFRALLVHLLTCFCARSTLLKPFRGSCGDFRKLTSAMAKPTVRIPLRWPMAA